jgi:hypothetical protein
MRRTDRTHLRLRGGRTDAPPRHRAVRARERARRLLATAPADSPSTLWVAQRSARPGWFTGKEAGSASAVSSPCSSGPRQTHARNVCQSQDLMTADSQEVSTPDIQTNEVRHPGWRVRQLLDPLLELPVSPGQPRVVLSQVLFPGRNEEELDKPPRCLAIAEHSPLCCACPQPRQAHVLHCLKEALLVLRRNAEPSELRRTPRAKELRNILGVACRPPVATCRRVGPRRRGTRRTRHAGGVRRFRVPLLWHGRPGDQSHSPAARRPAAVCLPPPHKGFATSADDYPRLDECLCLGARKLLHSAPLLLDMGSPPFWTAGISRGNKRLNRVHGLWWFRTGDAPWPGPGRL